MKTVPFGKTGLHLPRLTLGGMRFMQSWSDQAPANLTPSSQSNLEATLDAALAQGINHLETARGYGSSEAQLGKALLRVPRERVILQTKGAPKASNAEFQANLEASYQNLGVDYLDLYAVHGINNRQTLQWTLKKGGALDQLREYQRQGRLGHIGFSSHGYNPIILEAIATGEFAYVNLHFYLVNPSTLECLQAARRLGMGSLIISPNDKGGHLHTTPQPLASLTAPLHPMQLNALYCLSHPEVDTLSIGANCPADLDLHVQGLAYLEQTETLLPPLLDKINKTIKANLGEDWPDPWHLGIPLFDQIPGQVNVWEIVRLYTFGQGLGLTSFAQARYNMLGGRGGSWFPGEKASHFDASAIQAACALSPLAQRLPEILRHAHELYHA